MNEEVVERVMRMGIEGRTHSLDKLFDLARQQLKNRKSSVVGDEAAWMQQEHRFGFLYVKDMLTVVHVVDMTGLRIVEWRSSNWPLLERLH